MAKQITKRDWDQGRTRTRNPGGVFEPTLFAMNDYVGLLLFVLLLKPQSFPHERSDTFADHLDKVLSAVIARPTMAAPSIPAAVL